MDKSTLSNYGWIVIACLVLCVMIALASPFGHFVEDAVRSTSQGLFDVENKSMSAINVSMPIQSVTKTIYYGDIDMDGDIDVDDVTLLSANIPTWSLSDEAFKRADINKNNAVNAADLISLNRYLRDPSNPAYEINP